MKLQMSIMNSDLTISSIRDKGHKITDVRREIVNIFSKADKPLSAGDIYRILHSKKLKVNKIENFSFWLEKII